MQTEVRFIEPTIPLHIFDAERAGPTALIQAGIHGDEIAGVHALEELLEEGVYPDQGRLLIVPIMNPGAYRARERKAVGGLDLNRSFPGNAQSEHREQRLARKFMDLVEQEKPDLMATLHESWKRFHADLQPSFAQTIVYGVQPMPEIVGRVIDRMNETKQLDYETWSPHHYPVPTSSTEVIVDRVGCTGLCIETWMGFDLRRRIDMQKQIVRYLLEDLGVLNSKV